MMSQREYMRAIRKILVERLDWAPAEADQYLAEPDSWKGYWLDGYSPEEAILEDLSYADVDE